MKYEKPYQQLAVDREKVLAFDIRQLAEFFNTDTCKDLDASEKSRLDEQFALMMKLQSVLNRRIACFK